MATETNSDVAARLAAVREEIRQRVEQTAPPVPEASAVPVESLRQAAVAAASLASSVGTVNPRPPGLLNGVMQGIKEVIARLLDWQLRPQRDFNRASVECFTKTAELLDATSRNLAVLAQSLEPYSRRYQELAGELDRIPERTDRQINQLSQDLEEKLKRQRWALEGKIHRQEHDLGEKLHREFENEVRILRQRVAAQAKAGEVSAVAGPGAGEKKSSEPVVDYFQFERSFRGTEEEIRARQSFYIPFFRERRNVLDIACGRGEFLELMRELKVPAKGVDLDADMVGRCREKDLDVARADVFAYLAGVADASLDGIFSAQFVEHLPAEVYARLITESARKLAPGGLLAIETPNPECLAIFSQTFYLDPTHVRPIPHSQLRFLLAEAGFTNITAHFLSPAGAALPLIPPLTSRVIEPDLLRTWNDAVTRFNETFFGGMDYAVIGYRPTA